MKNLIDYLHAIEAAPHDYPEAAAFLASKMHEALQVTNEMAKLVIRYQGLLDRQSIKDADVAELHAVLGELAANAAMRVAALPALPDGPDGAAIARTPVPAGTDLAGTGADHRMAWQAWKTWASALVCEPGETGIDVVLRSKIGQLIRRAPLTRAEAVAIGKQAARGRMHEGHVPQYLWDATDADWQPHAWVVDAIIAASKRADVSRTPRVRLTFADAHALVERHRNAASASASHRLLGENWIIDAVIEASS